jgi:hypothetical protein
MNERLKLVDDKYAPRPHHGLMRAVYDTVDACGGANLKQIKQYLPAAIDNIGQVLKKGRLNRSLYHAVYRGYLVHDGKSGYWKIAPMSYYKARQDHCDELAEARTMRGGTPGKVDNPVFDAHDIADFGEKSLLTIRITKSFLMGVAAVAAVAAAFAAGRLL